MSSMDSYDEPQRKVRPTPLTVICVLAIVFGALGILSGGISLALPMIQQAITSQQTETDGVSEVQKEMTARSMEISKKYNPVMIPLTVGKILVEGALLIGAIMALGLKLSGKSLLTGAIIAAAILETIQFVPKAMLGRETQAVVAEFMPQLMAAQGGARGMPPGFDMSSMISGLGTVTLILGVCWLVIKIVLYLLGIRYLRRPDISALFSETGRS